jgi:hypothetical protein
MIPSAPVWDCSLYVDGVMKNIVVLRIGTLTLAAQPVFRWLPSNRIPTFAI